MNAIQKLDLRRAYAAAKTDRLTGPWNPGLLNINDILSGDWKTVTARAMQLCRDFPYLSAIVNRYEQFVVATGIKFECKLKDDKGNLLTRLNAQIEDEFKYFADECDISGKMHFYEMQQVAIRAMIETGEWLRVIKFQKNGRIPLKFQMLESLQLSSIKDNTTDTKLGIKYDPITGKNVTYYIEDSFGKVSPIDANWMHHGFKILRPGQLRGITPLASALLLAFDLSDFISALLNKAQFQSKWLAFQKLGNKKYKNESGKIIDTLENVIIEQLGPNDDIQFSAPPSGGSEALEFNRLICMLLSATSGVPYELLTGNYEGLSYTNMRVSRNDWRATVEPIIGSFSRGFNMPASRAFFDALDLSGRIKLPNYDNDPYKYWYSVEWVPDGWPMVDPLRETKTAVLLHENKLKAPPRTMRELGINDPYSELNLIAQWNKLMDELTVNVDKTSTAMANNPEAVQEQ